ncbi:hypothetical protein HGM15179_016992 [Zosterops borbonicus]|uniref:Uncharacterized protein n=1 Tax=Zosterops borbonicus TaxID=364589 RepID=A0A8K1G1P4_9PASS|nr:hypothetical protein HGM15179_016992 [Zosterops borbonicus]
MQSQAPPLRHPGVLASTSSCSASTADYVSGPLVAISSITTSHTPPALSSVCPQPQQIPGPPYPQLVGEPTRGDNMLDLSFTNRDGLVGDVMVGKRLGQSNHEIIEFSIVGEIRRGQEACGICIKAFGSGVGVADNFSSESGPVLVGEPLEGITHDCTEVVELPTKVRPDLEEEELEEGEKWFVDGSARVVEGKRKSGYAIVDGKTGKFGLALVPLKNILAAAKTVYLAIGGNLMGEGRGKGICLWGVLLVLSLVVCKVTAGHTKDQLNIEKQEDECQQCLRAIQKRQGVPRGAQFDCQDDMVKGYCTYNGTHYRTCKLGGEIICQSLKAESKTGKSEACSSHVLNKRNVEEITTIPVCQQCNRRVWMGGKTKSTFVGYFQEFLPCNVNAFLPCLISCFIRLIHSVVQGMPIATLPMDTELTLEKSSQSKVSKILALGQKGEKNKAAVALAKSEEKRQLPAEAEEEHEKEGVKEITWNEMTEAPILYSLPPPWEDVEELAWKGILSRLDIIDGQSSENNWKNDYDK